MIGIFHLGCERMMLEGAGIMFTMVTRCLIDVVFLE